jgi:hypothetical protein
MAQAFYGTRISDHISETPEKFLVCHSAPLARTATTVPQRYRGHELGLGTSNLVDVFRDAKEVFSKKFLASLEGKPVTDGHKGFINTQNSTWLVKGHVQNVRVGPQLPDGEQSIVGDLVITDSALIEKIRSGVRELSVGYQCKYVDNGDGSLSQTRLAANHVAVVSNGRAGEHVRIMDADGTSEEMLASAEPRSFDDLAEELRKSYNASKSDDEDDEIEEEEGMEMAKSDWEDLKREIKRIVAEEMKSCLAREARQREAELEEVGDEHPAVAKLRLMRPAIEASGDHMMIDHFNRAMKAAKKMRAPLETHLISAVDGGADARPARQAALANEFEAAACRLGAIMRGDPEPEPKKSFAVRTVDSLGRINYQELDHNFEELRLKMRAQQSSPLDEMGLSPESRLKR